MSTSTLPPGHKEHLYEYRPPGHWTIREGAEVKLKGEPGLYRFRYAVLTFDGREWVELIGPDKVMMFRAVAPSRIRSVPRKQGRMRGQQKPPPRRKK